MTQSKASEKIFLRISVFSSRDLLLRLFHHGMMKSSRFKVFRDDFYPAQVVTCFTKILSVLERKLFRGFPVSGVWEGDICQNTEIRLDED